MIDWKDIVLLSLSCMLVNHMGLISGIEKVIKHELPIVDCVKCLTFWSVLIFCLVNGFKWIDSIAVSFLSSYLSIWLELLFGFIDSCYEKIYKILYKYSEKSDKEDSYNKNATYSENILP